jgi:hypothetical protein
METLLSICIGIGLSAACGFRIFVPPLVMSIAVQAGQLELSPDFAWIGSTPATIAFAVGALLEVGAYYIPFIDSLLDVVATPTAVVAGTIISASMVSELSPMLQWTVAAIVGGGAAGAVQGLTDVTRLSSNTLTAGFANPGVSTMELLSSTVLSILAIAAPFLAAALVFVVLWLLWLGVRTLYRKIARKKERENTDPANQPTKII